MCFIDQSFIDQRLAACRVRVVRHTSSSFGNRSSSSFGKQVFVMTAKVLEEPCVGVMSKKLPSKFARDHHAVGHRRRGATGAKRLSVLTQLGLQLSEHVVDEAENFGQKLGEGHRWSGAFLLIGVDHPALSPLSSLFLAEKNLHTAFARGHLLPGPPRRIVEVHSGPWERGVHLHPSHARARTGGSRGAALPSRTGSGRAEQPLRRTAGGGKTLHGPRATLSPATAVRAYPHPTCCKRLHPPLAAFYCLAHEDNCTPRFASSRCCSNNDWGSALS